MPSIVFIYQPKVGDCYQKPEQLDTAIIILFEYGYMLATQMKMMFFLLLGLEAEKKHIPSCLCCNTKAMANIASSGLGS